MFHLCVCGRARTITLVCERSDLDELGTIKEQLYNRFPSSHHMSCEPKSTEFTQIK